MSTTSMRIEWRPDEADARRRRRQGLVQSAEVFPWLITTTPAGEQATRISAADAERLEAELRGER